MLSCRLQNDLFCVEWDVKLYYTIPTFTSNATAVSFRCSKYLHTLTESVAYHSGHLCHRSSCFTAISNTTDICS